MSDISKAELLSSLGYGPPHDPLLAILAEAGLTQPRNPRISLAKQDEVAELLARRFVRVCNRGDCRARAAREAPERQAVNATGLAACELCGGRITWWCGAGPSSATRSAGSIRAPRTAPPWPNGAFRNCGRTLRRQRGEAARASLTAESTGGIPLKAIQGSNLSLRIYRPTDSQSSDSTP
jgi:hypothetical protein